MEKVKDFVLNSEGQCFFCSTQILNPSSPNSFSEHDTESSCPSFTSIYCFTRYLGMDIRKVLIKKGTIASRLFSKVERPQLTVELCEDCAATIDKFSMLYEQFEKIELEMGFYLQRIQEKLAFAEDNKMTKFNPIKEFKGSREFVELFRTESLEKCKLRLSKPIVKVQNLTMVQLAVKRKLKHQNHFLSPDDASSTSKQNPKADADLHQTPSDEEGNDNEKSQQHNSISADDQLNIVSRTELYTGKSSAIKRTPSNISSSKMKYQRIFDPKTGKHKCGICSKEYLTCKAVWRHHNSIHLKLRYECRLCNKTFSQSTAYNRHYRNVHMGVKFKCEICKKWFNQKSDVLRHQLAYHEKFKKDSGQSCVSSPILNEENQTRPQWNAESVTPHYTISLRKRKEQEVGIASASPVEGLSSTGQNRRCDTNLERDYLDLDQAALNEENDKDFERDNSTPAQNIMDVDPDMTYSFTVKRPPSTISLYSDSDTSNGNTHSDIPTLTTEVVTLKAKEKSESQNYKRTQINNSLRYITDKRLRRKMLNKAASARYRQKMRNQLAAALAEKEKLQLALDGLQKQKGKLGTEFTIRASQNEMRNAAKSTIKIGNIEELRSKLRIIHRCSKCMKTFPTAVRLELHRKSEGCRGFRDKQI